MHATLELAKTLRQSNPEFETPIFDYRPYPGNPMAEQSAAQGYVFPRGLEEWADFDYVGGRGPWLTAEQWRPSSGSSSTRVTPGNRARGAGRFVPRRSGVAVTTGTRCPSRR